MEEKKLYKLEDVVTGTVTKIAPYGAFLVFPNQQIGLIHISEISDKFVRNIESFLAVGQQVAVKIIDIDASNNYLHLSLKQVASEQLSSVVPDGKKKRFPVPEEEVDFSPLAEKLPTWIADTLKQGDKKND